MSQNAKMVLQAAGVGVVIFLLINLIYFLITYFTNGVGEEWSIAFKQGTFFLNGQPTGLLLKSRSGIGLIVFVFAMTLLSNIRKKQLQ